MIPAGMFNVQYVPVLLLVSCLVLQWLAGWYPILFFYTQKGNYYYKTSLLLNFCVQHSFIYIFN
jgi:hypothetical protein